MPDNTEVDLSGFADELWRQRPTSLTVRDEQVDAETITKFDQMKFGSGRWAHADVRDEGALHVDINGIVQSENSLSFSMTAHLLDSPQNFSVAIPMTVVSEIVRSYEVEPSHDRTELAIEVAGDVWRIILEKLAHKSVQDLSKTRILEL